MASPARTPKKAISIISPSSSEKICVVCASHLNKYKDPSTMTIRLWKTKGCQSTSSAACDILERFFKTKMDQQLDFKVVCKNFLWEIKNCEQKLICLNEKFQNTRAEVGAKFTRTKFKRCPKFVGGPIKKRLKFLDVESKEKEHLSALIKKALPSPLAEEISMKEDELKVMMMHESHGVVCKTNMPKKVVPLFQLVLRQNIPGLVRYVYNNPIAKKEIIELVSKEINKELHGLCSDKGSKFKTKDVSLLKENMNFDTQFQELQEKTPIYTRVLIAAGINERNVKRNKLKTKDSLIPALMSATGIILKSRSNEMNTHAIVMGLLLKRAGWKKMMLKRLNGINACVSYHEVLKRQTQMGIDFSQEVLNWKENIEELAQNEGVPNTAMKYSLAEVSHEYGYHAGKSLKPSLLLPNVDDNKALRQEFRYLVANTLTTYCKELQWMDQYIPKYLTHEHIESSKCKSKVAVWDLIYDKHSASDIGTLHAARNFLNATNVPPSPMDNPDDAFDLLDKYTNALIIASYKGARFANPEQTEESANKLLDTIVDTYAIPLLPDITDVDARILQRLDTESLRDWMTSKTEDFQQLKIYQEIRLDLDV
eukprot:gene4311-4883_t